VLATLAGQVAPARAFRLDGGRGVRLLHRPDDDRDDARLVRHGGPLPGVARPPRRRRLPGDQHAAQRLCAGVGRRAGLVHETWEWLARDLHFKAPGSIAYAILDSRLEEIADWKRAVRSEVAPYRADTLATLARLSGVDAGQLATTVAAYNAACTGDPGTFDVTRRDGLAADRALQPPKSNWACAITAAPFLAYPLIGAVAYTFGGLATDTRARVLRDGAPIPGLYAAGEITGHFHRVAPNAVSVLRALVFGRIAGRAAAAELAATLTR
jgi:tricarballylate dehydrogenase